MQRIILLIIVLFVFFLLFLSNRYVLSRALWALDGTSYQKIFKITYWIFPLFFFVGQILERGAPHLMTKIISTIGSVWLAWFLYAFLFVVIIDFIRWTHYLYPWFPNPIFANISNKFAVFSMVFVFLNVLIAYGVINARSPIVKHHKIDIEKPMKNDLKIALVSDLHMGAIRGKKSIQKMVQMINKEHVDIVLIAGDLVDHNPRFAIKDEVGAAFENIAAPLGIYAVTGNHEYIGHAELSISYLSKHHVIYLRDSLLNISDQLILVGREDRQMQQVIGKKRKTVQEIIHGHSLDSLPVVLMDHQPVEYALAQKEKIDFMVSGHTHKGQMWPNNLITNMVYENHYGLMQKAKTWFYTSNGFGTWGPPVRIGNRPEVVVFTLQSSL